MFTTLPPVVNLSLVRTTAPFVFFRFVLDGNQKDGRAKCTQLLECKEYFALDFLATLDFCSLAVTMEMCVFGSRTLANRLDYSIPSKRWHWNITTRFWKSSNA